MNILKSKKLTNLGFDRELPPTNNLLKRILRISLPAAAEIFLIGLITMIDTMMVGSLGKEAIASVSITNQPVFITLTFCMGINAGVIAIISRRRGENDPEGANRVLRQALVVGTIISLIISSLSYFLAEPLLLLAGSKADTIDNSILYFRIVSTALFFNYIRLIITSALRACGNTKITLIVNITANIVNIFLNYCLIGGNLGFPAWGVAGAAIATVIGNFVAFVISIIAITRDTSFLRIRLKDDWRLDRKTLSNLFSVSSGAFVEQIFVRIGFFISARIVNDLGTYYVAVNTITQSVISLSFNIADGFAIGVSSLVGQSLGEKKQEVAFAYGRLSQILGIGISVVMLVATIVLRTPLAKAFSDEADVLRAATKLLLFGSIVIIPQSIQWITTGILRGSGDTKYTARTSMISIMIIRPGLSYLFCYPLGLGLYGAWFGMILDQTIRFCFNNYRFVNLRWARIEV